MATRRSLDQPRGILFAVVAYVAWGFLSPGGAVLLESMGPFTLNALRTLLALPILLLAFGPRTARDAFRSVLRDNAVWTVGALWLGGTFVLYLWSLRYLPPTITTMTLYFAPLFIAAWQRFIQRQRVSPLAVPVVAVTLVGAYLAGQGRGGVPLDHEGLLGLSLAVASVLGWVAYTIHVKVLTKTHEPNVITLAAFITSGVAMVVGAFVVEGFEASWSPRVAWFLAVYVAVPTVVSFWLYTLSLTYASATTVAVLLGVELVSTGIVSSFVTNEVFTTTKLLGLGIVLVAVTAYLWDDARRTKSARALAA